MWLYQISIFLLLGFFCGVVNADIVVNSKSGLAIGLNFGTVTTGPEGVTIGSNKYEKINCPTPVNIINEQVFCDGKLISPSSAITGKSTPPRNPCGSMKAKPHHINQGFISENAKVDANTYVPVTTSICGNITIEKNVSLGENVKITGEKITLTSGSNVKSNVEINGTGRIAKSEIGANTEINGTFQIENADVKANSELKGHISLNGIKVSGDMRDCEFRGTATEKTGTATTK